MTRFLRRLAIASAVASIPLAAAAVATSAVTVAAPGVSSPECDPPVYSHCVTDSPQCDLNWSRNVWTGECHPQPAVPDWYVVPAGICTAVRTGRRPAAASPSAMGRANPAEMGRGLPALGLVRI